MANNAHIFFFQNFKVYLEVRDQSSNPIKDAYVNEIEMSGIKISLQKYSDENGLILLGEFPTGTQISGIVEHGQYETYSFVTNSKDIPETEEGYRIKITMNNSVANRRSKIAYF